MASYQIEWKHSAEKELRRLPPQLVPRIVEAVNELAADPFPPGVKKLAGSEHTYRIRVSEYRIVYTVEKSRLLIEVVRVRHRREAYR